MAPCDDKASQSNPEEAAATHASLLMDVDFDTQVIQGSVEYTVEIMVCMIDGWSRNLFHVFSFLVVATARPDYRALEVVLVCLCCFGCVG